MKKSPDIGLSRVTWSGEPKGRQRVIETDDVHLGSCVSERLKGRHHIRSRASADIPNHQRTGDSLCPNDDLQLIHIQRSSLCRGTGHWMQGLAILRVTN